MKKNLSYIYLLLFLVNTSQAQMAMDTIELAEVKLVETRVATHDIGVNKATINIESLSEGSSISLDGVIRNSYSLYMKKYGALSTPSFRGTSSSHTLVLWNSIPINSIANGLSDFSSIYCHNFTDLLVVHGGDASVFGSGAIGGSLHLNTNVQSITKNKFSFSLTEGSYGLSSQSINFSLINGKLITSANLHFFMHENDFKYVNIAQIGHPFFINDYGKIKSNSQNIDFFYKLNNKTNYNLSLWTSNIEREVPQNMTILSSDAKQYDLSKRLFFSLNHKVDFIVFEFKQAYLQEDFRYTELIKDINSHYLAETYITDADIRLLRGNYLINIGTAFTNNEIENNNYTSLHQNERIFSSFSALQYKSKTLSVNTVIRKEWHTFFEVPLIPSIAFETEILDGLKFRAKYNRSFRSPTYNDRFWVGAGANGNENLNPEDAWNKEFGIDFQMKQFNFAVTAYNLHVSDMILWQQIENGSWTPSNIQKVFSRGIEAATKFRYLSLSFAGNYSFTKSTNEDAISGLDNTIGQQLRYVPIHKGNASVTIVNKDLEFTLSKSYTGEVIATYGTPENKILDGFLLTNISVRYKHSSLPISLKIKAKNLMNRSYISYQNYPNPGRELLLTLDYDV